MNDFAWNARHSNLEIKFVNPFLSLSFINCLLRLFFRFKCVQEVDYLVGGNGMENDREKYIFTVDQNNSIHATLMNALAV